MSPADLPYKATKKEKTHARNVFRKALVNGLISRPHICSRCGREATIDGHHTDYRKPLDVQWVCVPCHRKIHERLFEQGGFARRGRPQKPDDEKRIYPVMVRFTKEELRRIKRIRDIWCAATTTAAVRAMCLHALEEYLNDLQDVRRQ